MPSPETEAATPKPGRRLARLAGKCLLVAHPFLQLLAGSAEFFPIWHVDRSGVILVAALDPTVTPGGTWY